MLNGDVMCAVLRPALLSAHNILGNAQPMPASGESGTDLCTGSNPLPIHAPGNALVNRDR